MKRVPYLSAPTLWLVVILALATWLRLHHLGAESLWRDELFSRFSGAHASLRDVIIKGAAEDVHPPGFPLVMFATLRVIGDTEFALRLPSALAGIVAVLLIYQLGKSWFSPRVGLAAALLLAVNQFAVTYSQECRAYSLMLAMTLGFAVMATKIRERHERGEPTTALLVGLFLTGVSASYLHYWGLVFICLCAPVLLVGALSKRFPLKALFAVYFALLLAYLPWVSLVIAQASREKFWIRMPTLDSVWETLDLFTQYYRRWFHFILAAGAVVALGSWLRRRRSEQPHAHGLTWSKTALLVLWAVVPFAAAFLISYAVLPVYTSRNLIITLPALILLVALALMEIEGVLSPRTNVLVIAAASVLLFELVVDSRYYTKPRKEQLREAAQFLAGRWDDDVFLVAESDVQASYLNYYFTRLNSPARARGATGRLDVREVPASAREIWVLHRSSRPRGVRVRGMHDVEVKDFFGLRMRRLARSQ